MRFAPAGMKIPLNYGALIAFAGIVVSLVGYLLGYHNDLEKFELGNRISQIASLLISVIGILLAMRAVRAQSPDGSLSFGRAVGTGALVSLVSGAISAVYVLLYGLVINPEFHELILESATSKMSAEQADAAAGMMRFFTGAIWTSLMVLIVSPIFGTLISLIVALFVKKPAQTPPPIAA